MTIQTARVEAINSKFEGTGYHIEIKALVHRRGWPQKSTKPYQVYGPNGFIASFAKVDDAKKNMAGRAGC